MKANYATRVRTVGRERHDACPYNGARLKPGAVEAYGVARAMVDEQIKRQVGTMEDARRREMADYADALDATMLYTIHKELGLGAVRLRRLWEAMIRNRIEARLFFRDGDGYEELPTGHNIEDLGIHAELRKIGVDLKAWESEEIHVDTETGEVSFGAQT